MGQTRSRGSMAEIPACPVDTEWGVVCNTHPLLLAVWQRNVQGVAAAVAAMSPDDPQLRSAVSTNHRGFTALHVAAIHGREEIVNALLTAVSAKLNCDPSQSVPSSDAGSVDVSEESQQNPNGCGSTKILREFVNRPCGENHTALMYATYMHYPAVVECLVKLWGADPLWDRTCLQTTEPTKVPPSELPRVSMPHSNSRYSALHVAAYRGSVAAIDAILTHSSPQRRILAVTATDGMGFTPLLIACVEKKLDCVKNLLDQKWGEEVVNRACGEVRLAAISSGPIAPLYYCARYIIDDNEVLHLLCELGAINGLIDSIVWNISNARFDILIKHRHLAKVINELSSDNTTVLYAATTHNLSDQALKLMTLGADPNISGTRQDSRGTDSCFHTPLTAAFMSKQLKLAVVMMQNGAKFPENFSYLCAKDDPTFLTTNEVIQAHLEALDKYFNLLPTVQSVSMFYRQSIQCRDLSDTLLDGDTILPKLWNSTVGVMGVLYYLDVRTIGRLQQVSRIWYNIGCASRLWKQVLMNTSAKWMNKRQTQLRRMIAALSDTESVHSVNWKNFAFLWISRHQCIVCHKVYHPYDSSSCNTSENHLISRAEPELDDIIPEEWKPTYDTVRH
ncbi:hypothetical protein Pelo_15148 [Pelomyxa schiedti]|nr:hypothetical protein Pelo_15148 [Pelomyxa schiedti]